MKFLNQYKLQLITLFITLISISIATIISLNSANSHTSFIIEQLNNWIKQHIFIFALSHTILITAIYVLWGKRVDALSLKYKFSNKLAYKIKQIRLGLIGFIFIVDIFTFYLG